MKEIILAYQGEMTLKGLNRRNLKPAWPKASATGWKTWANSR